MEGLGLGVEVLGFWVYRGPGLTEVEGLGFRV